MDAEEDKICRNGRGSGSAEVKIAVLQFCCLAVLRSCRVIRDEHPRSARAERDKTAKLTNNKATMKKIPSILILIPFLFSCKQSINMEAAKDEILQTEKAFEKMASEKGLAEAFYFFAAEDAVILRGNDSLIIGRENIKNYYDKNANPNVKVSWTPDYIGVSDCGALGYTYGKYLYSGRDTSGKNIENKGVFHTVWKKQNNDWRYVWD
jgi:ketosteroid isomerase-like protein